MTETTTSMTLNSKSLLKAIDLLSRLPANDEDKERHE